MKLAVSRAIEHKIASVETKQVPALLESKKIVLPQDSEGYEIASLYIDDLITAGWKRGAVVSSNRLSKEAIIDPMNWGIILGHVSYPNLSEKPLRLIRVKWLNGSMEECNEQVLKLIQRPWWHSWDDLSEAISKPTHSIT